MPPAGLDHDQCYAVIRRRDGRFDGRFVTAVRTTGIFCRPSCPARTPASGNVEFYAGAAAAAEAGFRACRRCRPELAPSDPEWRRTDVLVGGALDLLDGGATPAEVGRTLGVSERHLRREFVRQLGTTPGQVVRMRRLATARLLLDHSDLSVTDVAFAAGFESIRTFNTSFRAAFGATPTDLRRRVATGGRPEFTVRLRARGDLDLAPLFGFLAARAIPGLESAEPDRWCRHLPGGSMTLRADTGTNDHLRVDLDLDDPIGIHAALSVARRVMDLDTDVAAIGDDLRADPTLAGFVPGPAPRVPGAVGRFELCCRAVVGQQVSVAGATTLLGRLVARAAGTEPGTTIRSFPTAAAVCDADLAGLGMPTGRIDTLRRLAEDVRRGALDVDATPDQLERRLLERKGIGPWTAGYVRMRAGDPDGWPSGDLVLRQRLGVTAPVLDRHAADWRPWRSYAAFALWQGDRTRHEPDPDPT